MADDVSGENSVLRVGGFYFLYELEQLIDKHKPKYLAFVAGVSRCPEWWKMLSPKMSVFQSGSLTLTLWRGMGTLAVECTKGDGHLPLCALEIPSKFMCVAHHNDFNTSFQMYSSFRQLWLNLERDIRLWKAWVLSSLLLPLAEVTAIQIC